ncbi:hypothetical protein CVT26_004640 [Gymnopilus dilepis]|uniref:Protein HRI1 n=1 Tax=Gymnopilus dilepis TaxID=231916 RepID=A0A409YTT5_9AGAR|nr:hypothetical protein CVT26_004640 [Gymnopilus dilepis]
MGYWEISERISLRWLPGPPSEDTTTLVINVGSFFVDLRIRHHDVPIDYEMQLREGIEWAMAGERQVLSQDPLKCRWIHIIDSRGHSEIPDEASFSKLPNGDVLERGRMPCPERGGEITEYEEVWRVVEPLPGAKWAWILQSEDGKSFLGRIGGTYIAMREGEEGKFAARREEWDDDEGFWMSFWELGEPKVQRELPSLLRPQKQFFVGEGSWRTGHTVQISNKFYTVKAFEFIQ